jgi:HD superfamily hydrolase
MNYKIMSDFEYVDIVSDIINNEEFLKLKFYRHHDNTRLDHCLKVSYNAYKLAKKFNLDYKAAARAGLLHDFFYGDLRYINVIERKYMLNAHPYFAYYNASKIFKLNEKEKDMILSHMFPISYEVPRYKESILLDLVDDLEALKEVGIYIRDRLKHNINLLLIILNEVV